MDGALRVASIRGFVPLNTLYICFAVRLHASAPELVTGVVHPWVGQIRLKRNGFKTLFKS